MKKPSKNISASLRGQSQPARGSESISVSRQKRVTEVGPVPGEGGVETAPGRVDGRSAVHHAAPMSRYGGR